jgi:KDO2-lipid IV(A) lauroyltransferase
VANAHAQGKGVFFVTGHFGYWEMQAITHPFHSPTIAVMARPLDNPVLHGLLEHLRTMTGNRVVYRQGALRRVLRELGANNGVAILIDQHLHTSEAVHVDYFGRPAATTSAVAALALRTGAVVIPVFALPLPGGRYRFIYEHPVPPPSPDAADPVLEFTQRCTDVLEMYVRRHPELWLWMHRRWREREPALAGGEPRLDDEDDDETGLKTGGPDDA